nr:MAG: RNA-dependent RNA polymerase [Plant tombusvirus-like associated RNA 3]
MFRRVLTYKGGPILAPEDGSWEVLAATVIAGLRKCGLRPTAPMSPEEYLGCYRGRKLTIYSKAFDTLQHEKLAPRDFEVKAFIKKEKDKSNTSDPRIIQPRSPRFHVSFGRYVRAIEGKIYKRWTSLWQRAAKSTATPVCFKGLNYLERGNFFAEKWATFNRPVAVSLDASRFDLHVSCDALRFTDDLYRACFHPRYRNELDYLLQGRHATRGVALCKESLWKYRKTGGRCSGDADTSLGNVCIMLAISYQIAKHLSIHLELANDGDDQVFILESHQLSRLLEVVEPTFAQYGFRVKVEEPVYDFERIDFCQTRPVRTPAGCIMTRYPGSAMTKDLASFLPLQRRKVLEDMLSAVGSCGLAAYACMPVLGQFYKTMSSVKGNGSKHWERTGVNLGYLYHTRGLLQEEKHGEGIHPSTRLSFWKAFGILPDLQEAMEAEIANWQPGKNGPIHAVRQFSYWWSNAGPLTL